MSLSSASPREEPVSCSAPALTGSADPVLKASLLPDSQGWACQPHIPTPHSWHSHYSRARQQPRYSGTWSQEIKGGSLCCSSPCPGPGRALCRAAPQGGWDRHRSACAEMAPAARPNAALDFQNTTQGVYVHTYYIHVHTRCCVNIHTFTYMIRRAICGIHD